MAPSRVYQRLPVEEALAPPNTPFAVSLILPRSEMIAHPG
jgi:hypothetical protein